MLDLAVKFGYKILYTHEVWGWHEKAPIFRRMMGELFKNKFLATKFSKMNMDKMTDEERDAFTREFFEVFREQVCVQTRPSALP